MKFNVKRIYNFLYRKHKEVYGAFFTSHLHHDFITRGCMYLLDDLLAEPDFKFDSQFQDEEVLRFIRLYIKSKEFSESHQL